MNFKNELLKILSDITNLGQENFLLEIPPENVNADFALPCFKLAKIFKKAPNLIALQIAQKISDVEFIAQVNVEGAYINFVLNKEIFAREIISQVLEKKDDFFKSDIGNGKNIVLDYSSPNIAKPFHVGHLRSTVIGNALYNIFSCLGYKCVSVNHLGDWGTQFGKLITAYKNWGNESDVKNKEIKELMKLYVKFHDEVQKNPALNDVARSWFVKMQDGDEQALKLWKWFNDISMEEFQKVYDRLGIKFDYYTGESFYNDKMQAVVDELKEKDLLVESDGAMIVDLENYKMPPCLILRRDGGTLYPTRDIAAAIYRKEKFDFDKCIYVTALDQKLHFEQWFKVVELMGYDWAKNLVHVPFGLVSLDSGKLSTRSGHVVLMEDLLDEAVAKTKQIINEKNFELENKDEIANIVGIGAVVFNDLYNSRIKDVTFSWDKILNFDGETGPYIQYTYVRTCSVLKKAGKTNKNEINYEILTDEASMNIIKLINLFAEKIIDAAEKFEPYIVSRHLMNIAHAFNKFYHDNYILNAPEQVKNARLNLTLCVNLVLKFGLELIGLKVTDVM
jgi:arginyl-tRNA synthetase